MYHPRVNHPERIGRYRVLGLLGQGAMGTVYRARDPDLDREVAVKVMSAGIEDDKARRRFESEAKAAARLQHPNIVTIYELGIFNGAPFMALEYLEGRDLQRAIEAGLRPDPRATLPIVLQLLAGLGHAHEHGIVHRDIKPSNLFLPRGQPAKIMDFGVARLGAGLTTAGMVVGTPNYMSPEQVKGAVVDGRSDLFSAALILYELVTGEKAFQADEVAALLYKIAHESPNLSLLPRSAEWEGLHHVLEKALARDPQQRYPDAGSMIADLEKALVTLGGTAQWAQVVSPGGSPRPAPAAPEPAPIAPVVAPAAAPPAAARRQTQLAGVLVVAAAAVVAAALVVGARRPAPPVPMPEPASGSPSVTPLRGGSATPASATPPAAIASVAPPPSQRPASASATPGAAPTPTPATPTPTPAPTADAAPVAPQDARLDHAEDLFEQGRYAQAMAEARAILARDPANVRARGLLEDAEVELLVANKIRDAQAALKKGDRATALDAVKAALAAKPSDSRLLALWKEAIQE